VRREGTARLLSSAVIARVAIAPLVGEPRVRAEQVSQLVLGETGEVLDQSGDWRRIRHHLDGYEGWVHGGYVEEVSLEAAGRWRERSAGWSLGGTLRVGSDTLPLPLRARVVVEGEAVHLPDGRSGRLVAGAIPSVDEVRRSARTRAPERWAAECFGGAPYLWGGVTPWGVDCSGLVQTTFAARGLALPRNTSQQVEQGAAVPLEASRPGDLLFFRGDGGGITHVAFAGEADTLIHATIARGGMVQESWLPGTRAAALRERIVAVRRLEQR